MGESLLTPTRRPFPRLGGVLHDGRATLVRRRERYSDLTRGELG